MSQVLDAEIPTAEQIEEIERLCADAERYRRLRDTKVLRIDHYGEELDRYLDEQSLWDQRAANSINGDTNG